MATSHNLVGERTGAWPRGDRLGLPGSAQPTPVGSPLCPRPHRAGLLWVRATCRGCSPVGDGGGRRAALFMPEVHGVPGALFHVPPQNIEKG